MSVSLSGALAQRIIDLASPSIHYNINIMDSTGLIIAAVDPARVGTMHQGARRALEQGEEYHVRSVDAATGSQPGVNLPFRSGDRIIGVVGVTGPPAEVESVARILRVTVELTVSMEVDQSTAELREARDRTFLSRLVHDPSALIAGSLDREFSRLPAPWRLTVFFGRDRAFRGTWPARVLREIEVESPLVARRWGVFEGALWVLGSDVKMTDVRERRNFVSVSTEPTHDTTYLALATRIARAMAQRPYLLSPGKTHWSTDELAAEMSVATSEIADVTALAFPLRRTGARHREILGTYIDANGNIAEIARRVGAHRNSVARRLDGLHELTGHDVRTSSGLVALTIALAAERRLNEEGNRMF